MGVKKRKERPDGFVIYSQGVRVLQLLSDEAAGKAIKAAITYFLTQKEMEENDSAEYLAFSVLKIDVDNCLDRFREMCQRNADNRGKDNGASPVVTTCDENREELKVSESEKRKKDIDTSGEDIGHQDPPAPQSNCVFSPPTLEQIEKYCRDRKYIVDTKKFYRHYTSLGWKKNGTQIQNWEAVLDGWEEQDRQKQVSDKTDSMADYAPNAADLERMQRLRQRLKDGTA